MSSMIKRIGGVLSKHKTIVQGVLGLLALGGVILLIDVMEWWEVIGFAFLNIVLGIKVAGAKTFSSALIKIGGKKALAGATLTVLAKRHLIDRLTKFFTEHSVERYKDNIIRLLKMKIREIRELPLVKKLKAILSAFASIPVVYYLWSKIFTGFVQKLFYSFVYPTIKGIFSLLMVGVGFVGNWLNFIWNFVEFLVQVLFLNFFLEKIEKYRIGKVIVQFFVLLSKGISEIFWVVNKITSFFGVDIKHSLIVYSLRFNRYLERVIYKRENAYKRVSMHREIHRTSREKLLIERELRSDKRGIIGIRKKNLSKTKKMRKLFEKIVLKKKDWRERREIRSKRVRTSKSGVVKVSRKKKRRFI